MGRRTKQFGEAVGEFFMGSEFEPSPESTQLENKDAWQQQFSEGAKTAAERQAQQVTGTQIAQGPQDQFRSQQQQLGDEYWRTIRGEGPSVARTQLTKSIEDAQRSAMAIAASNPSLSPAQAQEIAQRGMTSAQMQGGQQLAQLQAQEQLAARSGLGTLSGQARGQDIGLATSQAGLIQQAALANQQAALQQQQLNDQLVQYYTSQGLSTDMAELQARNQMEALAAQGGKQGVLPGMLTSAATGFASGAGGAAAGALFS